MHKITPFLWFDTQAEDAAKFYISIFKRSKIESVARYGDAGPGSKGKVMIVAFQLEGQKFIALNGGPQFSFTPAVSFFVECATQKEVDHFWNRLSRGGRKDQCGWLTDKFGLSWQIVPRVLPQLLGGKDRAKSNRVMQAMLKMRKLDINRLKRAARTKRRAQP